MFFPPKSRAVFWCCVSSTRPAFVVFMEADDESPARVLSLGEMVAARGDLRTGLWEKRAVAAEDGWRRIRLDVPADRVTYIAPAVDPLRVAAQINASRHATPVELFECAFPFDVMAKKLQELRDEGSKVRAFLLYFCLAGCHVFLFFSCSTRSGASHDVGQCGRSQCRTSTKRGRTRSGSMVASRRQKRCEPTRMLLSRLSGMQTRR